MGELLVAIEGEAKKQFWRSMHAPLEEISGMKYGLANIGYTRIRSENAKIAWRYEIPSKFGVIWSHYYVLRCAVRRLWSRRKAETANGKHSAVNDNLNISIVICEEVPLNQSTFTAPTHIVKQDLLLFCSTEESLLVVLVSFKMKCNHEPTRDPRAYSCTKPWVRRCKIPERNLRHISI